MKRTLTTLLAMALLATAASGAIFEQTATSSSDWTAGAKDGTPDGVDISNPSSSVTIAEDRAWAAANAGIGQLDQATGPIQWSFDFSNASLLDGNDDTFSVILAGTSGVFDGSGSGPADGYLFGTALGGGNLLFGTSDRMGKNGVETVLYDTGVSAEAAANGSATISFDPSTGGWTITGSYNGQDFATTGSSFLDNTYTGVATDYLGLYSRAGSDTVALSNMTVVPEPMTLSVLGLGGVALIKRRRR
jgi:hypothetical protein